MTPCGQTAQRGRAARRAGRHAGPQPLRAHRTPGHRRGGADPGRRADRGAHERPRARGHAGAARVHVRPEYENQAATAEFSKAHGILGGLWEKVRADPARFLDPRTVEAEGLDRAAQDFLAGMTDRYAVNLFEQLYIPKPWVTVTDGPRMV
ncbi:MAG: hypothetical protein R2712_06650 [Vicinamibacterales bacterium]